MEEVSNINENWQNEIYKISNHITSIKTMEKDNNNQVNIEDNNNNNNNNEQLINELNGRIQDLSTLQNIYVSNENNNNQEEQVEQLLQIIKQRHDNEENKLNHEIFIQNNQEWRNILKQQQQVELSNNQETIQQQLTNECLQRTKEFEHIIDVLKKSTTFK